MNDRREEMTEKLNGLLQPILAEQGVDLLGVRITGGAQRYQIGIFIDRPAGGITIGQCSLVNRLLTKKIEGGNLIPEDYLLEVSSPGLDWPLVTEKDFKRVLSRVLKVSLREDLFEKREYIGVLESVGEGSLAMREPGGQEVTIPFSYIQKAVQYVK